MLGLERRTLKSINSLSYIFDFILSDTLASIGKLGDIKMVLGSDGALLSPDKRACIEDKDEADVKVLVGEEALLPTLVVTNN